MSDPAIESLRREVRALRRALSAPEVKGDVVETCAPPNR